KARAIGAEVSQALNPAQQIVKIVNEELIGILGGDTRLIRFAKQPPTVIMLAGLQGAGKTTLAGKLARWLKANNHAPLLVASDLQRPNAVQQLQVVGGQAGVDVFAPEPGSGVGDPVDVARKGIEHAVRWGHDVVIVDTAGRLGIDADMMAQAIDIRDAVSPDEILFVVDAMVGQDAVVTAQAFLDGVGFSGVVLTKLDGDARGGAALSVAQLTGRPIMFASTGEKLADFDVFHPERMASRILGMGDVLTLIEQAEQHFDQAQTEKLADKLMGDGDFTLEDFLDQMLTIRKMGPIGNLLGMLPGMGQMKEALAQVDDADIDRITAIIRSMTPAERADAKIINGSRRARISAGAGVTVAEVNSLVDRFFEARKMMKSMAGGMPGMPGMRKKGGGGGGKSARTPKSAKKGKGAIRSGRPGAVAPARQAAVPNPAGTGQPAPGAPQLPPGFQMPDLSQLRRPDHPR
ncbi:MAG: signal recognition particle subunit, partial [Frankiales bacterium]|nr:signal recognition particle subunit [Frankiales bacterium]